MATLKADGIGRFASYGALAGVLATLVFTIVHQLLISPIWFAFPAMLAAGSLCGACLAWSYLSVARAPSQSGWLGYNLLYLFMLGALGCVSLLAFEPVTTIATLLATSEPPRALIGQALPMTGVFMVVAATLLGLVYRPSPRGILSILVTVVLMVLLLGLNISVLGFVDVPSGAAFVLLETFGLLLVLMLSYSIGILLLTGVRLARRSA